MTQHPPTSPEPDWEPVDIDTSAPHPARIYDYLLGGTENFAVDREAAAQVAAAHPGGLETARAVVRANRVLDPAKLGPVADALGARR